MNREKLLWQLEFNEEQGTFSWKNSSRGGWNGKPAGTTEFRSVIRISNKGWFRSHLVWLAVTGSLPPKGYDLDHKNRNKLDDRFSNLRLASRSQNCMNKEVQANNSSGYRNIHQISSGSYVVQIKCGSTRTNKTFKTLQEAIIFRDLKIPKLHGVFKGVYEKAEYKRVTTGTGKARNGYTAKIQLALV